MTRTHAVLAVVVSATASLFAPGAAAATLSVATDAVPACHQVRVRYADLPPTASGKGNWLAVAPVGSVASHQSYRFAYLPAGSTSGVHAFSTRGLMPFTPYEVRAYLDWEGTHSYEIVARAEFLVLPNQNCRPPLISRVTKPTAPGEPLAFAFQNVKKSASNWVTLALPEQPATAFLKSTYLPQAVNGEAAISTADLAPGIYELRLYEDWAGSKEYFVYARVSVTLD